MSDEAAPEVPAPPKKTPEEEVKELAESIGRYPPRKLAELQLEFLLPPAAKPYEKKPFWPGNMTYYGERGNFLGAKLKLIRGGDKQDAVERFNKFFDDNPSYLCCDYKPTDDGIYVVYTSQLDEEQQAAFEEFNREVDGRMGPWHEARAHDKRTAQTEKELALTRLLDLAEAGARYLGEVKPNLKAEKKAKRGKK